MCQELDDPSQAVDGDVGVLYVDPTGDDDEPPFDGPESAIILEDSLGQEPVPSPAAEPTAVDRSSVVDRLRVWATALQQFASDLEIAGTGVPLQRGLSLLIFRGTGDPGRLACRLCPGVVAGEKGCGFRGARECQPLAQMSCRLWFVPDRAPLAAQVSSQAQRHVRVVRAAAGRRLSAAKPGSGGSGSVVQRNPPRGVCWAPRGAGCLPWDILFLPLAAGEDATCFQCSLHWVTWDNPAAMVGRPARLDTNGRVVWAHPATRRGYQVVISVGLSSAAVSVEVAWQEA